MKKTLIFFVFIVCVFNLYAQTEATAKSKLNFTGDFRFRIEQDWESRKPDGTYRDDRTRLRYRARVGASYDVNNWALVGMRIRTGFPNKQQDPQLTLGDGYGEFNTLPIGFEKIFFQIKYDDFLFWVGKNTFPFEKNNELFWSDNVFPEGVFLMKSFPFKSNTINQLDISGGHFIIGSAGTSFKEDSYFEGFQVLWHLFDNKLKFFPSFYSFKNMPNIPDGGSTYIFDYSILHLGAKVTLLSKPFVSFEADYYSNLENYNDVALMPSALKDQKHGYDVGLTYGQLKAHGDWFFKLTYTNLEQYAAVDFLAQNDWARWDYSSFDSPDGRLTNLKGIELVGSYAINKNIALTAKYYVVEQLIPYGNFTENGNRIRFDIDVKL